MDRGKITYISQLPNAESAVVSNALNEADSHWPSPSWDLALGCEDMLYQPSRMKALMVSLLYYFGVLTLTERRTSHGQTDLHHSQSGGAPACMWSALYDMPIAGL